MSGIRYPKRMTETGLLYLTATVTMVSFYWARKFYGAYAWKVFTAKVSPSETYPLYGIIVITWIFTYN